MADNKEKPSIFSSLGLVLVLLAIIFSGYKLGGQLEQLDDKLSYSPPVTDSFIEPGNLPPMKSGTVYLPIYSHVFTANQTPVLLEAMASLRNTDPNHGILIHSVDYFDSSGVKIDSLLESPVRLAPMASAELVIETSDKRGGTGANLLIHWSAEQRVNRPLFEAVMSASEPESFAFGSRGVELKPAVTAQ